MVHTRMFFFREINKLTHINYFCFVPKIDILISSNIERLLWTHFGPFRVKELMKNLAEEKYFQVFSFFQSSILRTINGRRINAPIFCL